MNETYKNTDLIINNLDTIIDFINGSIKEREITQRELAEYSGTTEASMSRWLNKNRKMPFDIAIKCVQRLGCNLYLI